MKKSFKDIDTAVVDVPATELATTTVVAEDPTAVSSTSFAPVPAQSGEVVPESFFSNEAMEGEYTSKDIKIPRLNLVAGIGPISALLKPGTNEPMFKPGVFAFQQELDLGGGPIHFTLLRMKKSYQEALPYQENGPKPKFAMTEKEVRSRGAFMIWEKKERPGQTYYKPVLDAEILIQGKPEYDSFPCEFEGLPYARALWTLQSTAYSRAATVMIAASQLGLRAGLHTGSWVLNSKREKVGANWVWVPVVRQGPKHKPEFVEFARSLLHGI